MFQHPSFQHAFQHASHISMSGKLLPIPAEWGEPVSAPPAAIMPVTMPTSTPAVRSGGRKRKAASGPPPPPDPRVGDVDSWLSSVRVSLEASLGSVGACSSISAGNSSTAKARAKGTPVEQQKQQTRGEVEWPQAQGEEEALHVTPGVRMQQQADTSRDRYSGHGSNASCTPALAETIRSAIQSARSFESRTKMYELNLDTVLSSTSYRSLMKQVFGSDGSIMPSSTMPTAGTSQADKLLSARIPTITRSFEVCRHSHRRGLFHIDFFWLRADAEQLVMHMTS